MRAAARTHHVAADSARKAQHQIGTIATRGQRSNVCKRQQSSGASQGNSSDPLNFEIARRAAQFAREYADLVTARAEALRGNQQIAFGAATVRIKSPGE